MDDLRFSELRKPNVERCGAQPPEGFGHGVEGWSVSDWSNALAGEVGELCNKTKKLRRGEAPSLGSMAEEIADVVIYADLVAARLGLDLGEIVREKFNRKSREIGSSIVLPRADGRVEEPQTCPRRMTEMGPWKRAAGLDRWEFWGPDRACSFCGSMHPEEFLKVCRQAAADEGHWHDTVNIERSTKGYKFYIRRPGIHNAGDGAIKFYAPHAGDFKDALEIALPAALKVSGARFEAFLKEDRERREARALSQAETDVIVQEEKAKGEA